MHKPHTPERTWWPPRPTSGEGQALNRLGANLWPCCLCGRHFRRDPFGATNGQLVHCVTGKRYTGDASLAELSPTDLKWDYRYQYIITYGCSNRCAWWYSQHLRSIPDIHNVRLWCYRYVGTVREDVLP